MTTAQRLMPAHPAQSLPADINALIERLVKERLAAREAAGTSSPTPAGSSQAADADLPAGTCPECGRCCGADAAGVLYRHVRPGQPVPRWPEPVELCPGSRT